MVSINLNRKWRRMIWHWKNEGEGMPEFPCDKCGICCKHLSGLVFYQDLDNGKVVE